MLEIKANMGHCRDAEWVINKLLEYNNKFKNSLLNCKLSTEEDDYRCIEVNYNNSVKLFLVSFLYGNCSPDNHVKNKIYANDKNVFYYNLFRGWYGILVNFEIEDFSQNIISKAYYI